MHDKKNKDLAFSSLKLVKVLMCTYNSSFISSHVLCDVCNLSTPLSKTGSLTTAIKFHSPLFHSKGAVSCYSAALANPQVYTKLGVSGADTTS